MSVLQLPVIEVFTDGRPQTSNTAQRLLLLTYDRAVSIQVTEISEFAREAVRNSQFICRSTVFSSLLLKLLTSIFLHLLKRIRDKVPKAF